MVCVTLQCENFCVSLGKIQSFKNVIYNGQAAVMRKFERKGQLLHALNIFITFNRLGVSLQFLLTEVVLIQSNPTVKVDDIPLVTKHQYLGPSFCMYQIALQRKNASLIPFPCWGKGGAAK